MKIEQLIVQFLYNSKKLSLQDIGIFTLSTDISIPFENNKETAMPANAVSFVFDKKARQDDDLIAFIVEQTRKIKPLATSDLESYSLLAKQFLNIGKPFPIEGLGVLQKTQSGEYEFLQGHSINAKLESASVLPKEKSDPEISFASPAKQQDRKKWVWLFLFLFFGAILISIYYFFRTENKTIQPVHLINQSTDSLSKPTAIIEHLTVPVADSVKPVSVIPAANTVNYQYKVVIKEFGSREIAEKTLAKLTSYGHELIMYTADSVKYKIAIPFKTPISDTARVMDSLNRFFNTKSYFEKY